MKNTDDLKKVQKFLLKDKNLKIIVIFGLVLIVLIFLLDLFSLEEKNIKEELNADSYIEELEKRLSEIISQIEGAGRVKIMLTLESLEENIYSVRETAVTTIKPPTVRGVAVVCEGGNNIIVKEKIVETVSKVLGVSTSKVCVTN